MAMEVEMEVAMAMVMVMVIFGARKASSELRFASKLLLTSDFQVLEASGVQATKRAPRAPKKPPRGYRGVLKTLPRDSFEVLWELLKSKKLLKPRSSIHPSVRKGTTELGIRLSPG